VIRRRRLKQELEGRRWDILILQETKLKGFIFRPFDSMFRDCLILHGTSEESRGLICMIVKNHVRIIDKGKNRNGRWVWCDIEAGEEV